MKGVTRDQFDAWVSADPLAAVERSLARLLEDGDHWPDDEVVRGLSYRELAAALNGARGDLGALYADPDDGDDDWDRPCGDIHCTTCYPDDDDDDWDDDHDPFCPLADGRDGIDTDLEPPMTDQLEGD